MQACSAVGPICHHVSVISQLRGPRCHTQCTFPETPCLVLPCCQVGPHLFSQLGSATRSAWLGQTFIFPLGTTHRLLLSGRFVPFVPSSSAHVSMLGSSRSEYIGSGKFPGLCGSCFWFEGYWFATSEHGEIQFEALYVGVHCCGALLGLGRILQNEALE